MKIVIEIPEETYEALVINQYCGSKSNLENIIVNGTPLPKGHGRLIDADAMQKYQIDTFGQRLLVIDTAPTIIKADKEGEG